MIQHLLAVDAGLRGAGTALFNDCGGLVRAAYVRNPDKTGTGVHAWGALANAVYEWVGLRGPVAIETMRHRPGREKGNPQNILEVQGVAAAIAFTCCSYDAAGKSVIAGYEPQVWKGTVKKDVMLKRIFGRLSATEAEVLPEVSASLLHNVLDACGIGLYHLGRLTPARVVVQG